MLPEMHVAVVVEEGLGGRFFFVGDADLALQEQGPGAGALDVELDLEGGGRGEPGAADYADHAAPKVQLGDVLIESDLIVDMWLAHGVSLLP